MNRLRFGRHLIKIILVILLVALGIYALMPSPVPVEVALVSRGPMRVTLDHEGKTRVKDRFVISAPVSGKLLRIELDVGDPVTAGQTVVAEIIPALPIPLDARSRKKALAEIAYAKALLERARARREIAAAEAQLAEREKARILKLAKDEAVSEQEKDKAIAEARKAYEALRAAEADVKAALAALQEASANLIEPSAIEERSDGTISARSIRVRCPVSGVVLRLYRESEGVVQAGEPLLEIGDLKELEVIADFVSTDAVRIKPGMPALITKWGGSRPLRGRVRRVEPSGFTKISALGVEEQRVWVVVDLLDPPEARGALGDGYRVEVQVVVWEKENVLTVPVGALFRRNGAWAVFRVEDKRAKLTLVKIGRQNGERAEVHSGLKEGDVVVVYPPERLEDGLRVTKREL